MQALFTLGDLVDVRPEERTGKKNAGWLRKAEATATGRVLPDRETHLTPHEKKLLANLYTHIKNVTDASTALVAHAWGVLPKTVRSIVKKMVESTDLSVARKKFVQMPARLFSTAIQSGNPLTPLGFAFCKRNAEKILGNV